LCFLFFFFNDTATTEIYTLTDTLSLHDALPISSWLDKDMAPGLTSESVYVPGKGLTLIYQGHVRGTIAGDAFADMYYRYNVGEKADTTIREGLLGL
jgi:hypothetical protein